MTEKEFIDSRIVWARGILSQPAYTMLNGKKSHSVAHEVLGECMDRMLDTHHVNAYGTWR